MENQKLVNSQYLPTNAPTGLHVIKNNVSEQFIIIDNKFPPHQVYRIGGMILFLRVFVH